LSNLNDLVAIIELEDDVNDFTQGQESANRSLAPSHGLSCALDWSQDGQLLAVVSPRQILHVFLSQLPMLFSVSASGMVARLTSLLEVTIEPLFPEISSNSFESARVLLVTVEPNFIAIGPNHLAVGVNNQAWFYDISAKNGESLVSVFDVIVIDPKKFPAKMQKIAVLAATDSQGYSDKNKGQTLADKLMPYATRQQKTFAEPLQEGSRITDIELTEQHFIYSTSTGALVHFLLEAWVVINEYKHINPIRSIFANKAGTLVAFIDERGGVFIFNSPLLVILDKEKLTVYRFFTTSVPNSLPNSGTRVEGREKERNFVRIPSMSNLPDFSKLLDNSQPAELTAYAQSPLQFSTASNTNTASVFTKTQRSFQTTIYGECRLVGATRLPPNHTPLGIFSGQVCFLGQTGRQVHAPLSTHAFRTYTRWHLHEGTKAAKEAIASSAVDNKNIGTTDTTNSPHKAGDANSVSSTAYRSNKVRDKATKDLTKLPEAKLVSLFEQAVLAGDFEDALLLSDFLLNRARWHQLGLACVKSLDFECAIQAFRRLNHCGLVLAVQRMAAVEEKHLLYGYVSMFLGDFDRAQEFFLASSKPIAALEMRRDLLHWDAALQLARSLQPSQVPLISREYAFELECVGDYVNALMYFERALDRTPCVDKGSFLDGMAWLCEEPLVENISAMGDVAVGDWNEHEALCNAGIARNTIRLGDYKRGIAMATKHPSRSLKKECALILEQARQWTEAAVLHEAAGQIDAAVAACLKCKNYDKAGILLKGAKVSPKMYLEYAKAREVIGSYKEAVIAYESAKDWTSVVRLLLEKLNNPADAVRVVNESKTAEGAKMVAQYFMKIGDFGSAIQFLVMSKCHSSAYDLAQKHKKMEVYAEVIGTDATPSEYKSIAVYFECEKNWLMAGKFFYFAKQYAKAVRHLLRVPYTDNSPALDLAIEAVGEAKDEKLTHMLIIYLMGETDGLPKDARHLFRLYMALQQYREAARTAVIIAREEQMAGNYRNAHDLLFSMVQELRQRKIKVASEMLDNLALLHSYTLAKLHIKAGNHVNAAHVVPILTSTVIECQRVGLKTASFTYASMLLRPEYREKIDQKYRRKFEGIVRRPEKQTPEELEILRSSSPCPFCSADLGEYDLNCASCRNNVSYCALTVRSVINTDIMPKDLKEVDQLLPTITRSSFSFTMADEYAELYQMLQQQLKLMESLTVKLSNSSMGQSSAAGGSQSIDHITGSITEFLYDPQAHITFDSWYKRYEDLFLEGHPDLTCPMCSVRLTRDSIRRLTDAMSILLAWNAEGVNESQTNEQTDSPVAGAPAEPSTTNSDVISRTPMR
uniref:ANAPC4_WD40 domain-containing protein n=1 Tax=Schistocephalus solidus TaxID=70667 RepID=A0A183SE63_SCHSO